MGTGSAYVDSLLDQSADAFPINRLAREAAMATRTALRTKPREVANPAVRKALHETVFRFDLVMRINVIAHEMVDREGLLYMVFAGQLALLASEDRKEQVADPAHGRRLALCREFTAGRVTELLAAQAARSIVEGRYLDGHRALFPDAVVAWTARLQEAESLAVMADRLAELDGVPPTAPPDAGAVSARTAMLVADLVEPARSTALDKLDEGRQALAIATDWLHSKGGVSPVRARPRRAAAGNDTMSRSFTNQSAANLAATLD